MRHSSLFKRLKAMLLGLFVMTNASATPPDLVGAWRSDHDLTMAFIRERARVNEKAIQVFDRLMGRLLVKFTTDKTCTILPDEQAGETLPPQFACKPNGAYRVIGRTEKQIAVLYPPGLDSDEPKIEIYNFVSPDIYWVYVGNSDPQSKINFREYFRRTR